MFIRRMRSFFMYRKDFEIEELSISLSFHGIDFVIETFDYSGRNTKVVPGENTKFMSG